jgi:hypothetical protein
MPLAAGIKSIAAKESLISYHVHYLGWAASVTPCYGAGAAAELGRSLALAMYKIHCRCLLCG